MSACIKLQGVLIRCTSCNAPPSFYELVSANTLSHPKLLSVSDATTRTVRSTPMTDIASWCSLLNSTAFRLVRRNTQMRRKVEAGNAEPRSDVIQPRAAPWMRQLTRRSSLLQRLVYAAPCEADEYDNVTIFQPSLGMPLHHTSLPRPSAMSRRGMGAQAARLNRSFGADKTTPEKA